MTETWRAVPGYDGFYEISDAGRIRSVRRIVDVAPSRQAPAGCRRVVRERILRPSDSDQGRPTVTLWRGHRSAQFHVHKLVMLAFVGPRPHGAHICHNDGDSHNNRLSNLRYDTAAGNNADKRRHGTHLQGERIPWARLREADVILIRQSRGRRRQSELAAKFGVSQAQISRVMNGHQWEHVPRLGDTPEPEAA